MNERIISAIALLAALIILGIGFTAAGIYGGHKIPDLLQVTARGVVPPGFVAILGEQRAYTVWLAIEDEEEEIARPVGHIDYLPPSAEVEIIDLSTGKTIELLRKPPIRRLAGGETTIALGEFRSDRPGQQIQLKASGLRDSVTMSVMPTSMGHVLRVSISLIGITVITIGTALLVLHRISRWTVDSSSASE